MQIGFTLGGFFCEAGWYPAATIVHRFDHHHDNDDDDYDNDDDDDDDDDYDDGHNEFSHLLPPQSLPGKPEKGEPSKFSSSLLSNFLLIYISSLSPHIYIFPCIKLSPLIMT